MNTTTTDFTGTYDWPAEEATAVSAVFSEDIKDGYYKSPDHLHQAIIKERNHWMKVFGSDAQGQADVKRFSEVFNSVVFPLSNFAL